jgi:hypothetical protein
LVAHLKRISRGNLRRSVGIGAADAEVDGAPVDATPLAPLSTPSAIQSWRAALVDSSSADSGGDNDLHAGRRALGSHFAIYRLTRWE